MEEVMRTTQWDYVEREFVTKVQYRTWDATKQIWFIFEKDLPRTKKEKSSIIQRGVYYEGWSAFQGEDFLKLGCEKLVELCPYDRYSVEYSEWFEGWISGAKWFWNNELKVTETDTEIKKDEEITVC